MKKLDKFTQEKIFAIKWFGAENFKEWLGFALKCDARQYDKTMLYKILREMIVEISEKAEENILSELFGLCDLQLAINEGRSDVDFYVFMNKVMLNFFSMMPVRESSYEFVFDEDVLQDFGGKYSQFGESINS